MKKKRTSSGTGTEKPEGRNTAAEEGKRAPVGTRPTGYGVNSRCRNERATHSRYDV